MSQKKNQWTLEEIQLLENIKRTHKQKKWKMISKNLAKRGYKRSEHQIRHKWVNCLNPQINHGPWTDEELRILYQQYDRYFSQWSLIQKALPRRTQIRIKNHFYGILRNILRYILKYFKNVSGKQSELSNKINPNTLQHIYRGTQQYSFVQNTIRNAIADMQFHFDKQKLLKIIHNQQEIFWKLNAKIIEEASAEAPQRSAGPSAEITPRNQPEDCPQKIEAVRESQHEEKSNEHPYHPTEAPPPMQHPARLLPAYQNYVLPPFPYGPEMFLYYSQGLHSRYPQPPFFYSPYFYPN